MTRGRVAGCVATATMPGHNPPRPYIGSDECASPHRLAWPRTSGFHPENRGSNPLGDVSKSFTERTWAAKNRKCPHSATLAVFRWDHPFSSVQGSAADAAPPFAGSVRLDIGTYIPGPRLGPWLQPRALDCSTCFICADTATGMVGRLGMVQVRWSAQLMRHRANRALTVCKCVCLR